MVPLDSKTRNSLNYFISNSQTEQTLQKKMINPKTDKDLISSQALSIISFLRNLPTKKKKNSRK